MLDCVDLHISIKMVSVHID